MTIQCISNKNTKLTDASIIKRIISFDVFNCALLSLKKKQNLPQAIELSTINSIPISLSFLSLILIFQKILQLWIVTVCTLKIRDRIQGYCYFVIGFSIHRPSMGNLLLKGGLPPLHNFYVHTRILFHAQKK